MRIVAIINPISGAGADRSVAGRRVAMLDAAATRRGCRAEIHLTERAGHARELAAASVASGTDLVVVWGGDGTINEAGGALMGSNTTLGVIPAGSGNGLAAALNVPRTPETAIDIAFDGREWRIDAGIMADRPFFNVAGIGFDAHIARLFNERGAGRRGRWPYVTIGVREGCVYRSDEYRVRLGGEALRLRAFLISFANGREFGMGARIAPQAALDDGLLDATVVAERGVVARFWDARHLAFGAVGRAPRVTVRTVEAATVEADGPIEYHVDGEPGIANRRVDVRVVPGALKVKVPRVRAPRHP
jgi:YegS/Rv2252/BmrU family lipid kinase